MEAPDKGIARNLGVARGVLDQGWAAYEIAPDEAQTEAREALIHQAVAAGFPRRGMALSAADLTALADEVDSARRSWVELLRLRVDHGDAPKPADATTGLIAWGADVAARQADDWMTLVDRLRRSTRHYRILDGEEAGLGASQQRKLQRFARRCAAELGIATPNLRWIKPVRQDGDLVTLGDIAGCAVRTAQERPVIFVRCDITDRRDLLRVVAHEVAHHGGADEDDARAYEQEALRRHA